MKKISSAIISVFDKTGLTAFVSELEKSGVNIFSTGGTYTMLRKENINASKIEDYTAFPEMMDGRVKTLHPKIHGGILAKRDNEKHMSQAAAHNIQLFDMVVVNLYPFRETVEKGLPLDEIIENIDIGGPSMIRSAAKNYNDVAIITNPEDYYSVLNEMKQNGGFLSSETRYNLAKKAFSLTALYDGYISSFFSQINHKGEKIKDEPDIITLQFTKKEDLRYGENPHQKGTVYLDTRSSSGTIANAKQLAGKQLSFNNYLDLESAKNIVFDFEEPAVAILKHTNPCGVAVGKTLAYAYEKALACDPVSAYGSVIGLNREVDIETANLLSKLFVEVIVAPSFCKEAIDILGKKKNLRLLELGIPCQNPDLDWEIKKISGGLLVEDADRKLVEISDFKVVTEKQPTDKQIEAMLFGQRIVKHVKSNAIVIAGKGETVGIGAGQMSRIDSMEMALKKARKDVSDCIIASDAFFPFRDCVDMAAKAGIKAIIQPGGSVRDDESIAACNEHGIAMVFTSIRNFRHL